MRWSERQRAMLAAMGVRLWQREPVVAVGEGADTADADTVDTGLQPTAEVAVERARVERSVAPPPRDVLPALPAADWLVVGEPLDAAAQNAQAQLLDNMLFAIGVRRDAPGRTGRATYFDFADKPEADAEVGSEARLRAAVEAVRPRCVIALGRQAAQAACAGDEPLGTLRGRVHRGLGVPVVVTCSLAFLLRHGEEKPRAWADLCLAARTFDEASA